METKRIPLSTGNYTAQQAKELLNKMIKNEQEFHKLQRYISLIRYEENCEQSNENIQRLSCAQEEINSFLEMANASGLHLKIDTSLRISLVEESVLEHAEATYPSL
jgi:DNA-binding transcriptional regulator/RsmH inhibitor MraZ